jgi:hypothetical protein
VLPGVCGMINSIDRIQSKLGYGNLVECVAPLDGVLETTFAGHKNGVGKVSIGELCGSKSQQQSNSNVCSKHVGKRQNNINVISRHSKTHIVIGTIGINEVLGVGTIISDKESSGHRSIQLRIVRNNAHSFNGIGRQSDQEGNVGASLETKSNNVNALTGTSSQ